MRNASALCRHTMIAAAALLATGCSHVPLTTVYHLAMFDPLAADPAALRAAIRHPVALAPQPGGIKVLVTKGRKGEAGHQVHAFALEPADGPAERAPLAAHLRPGFDVLAFRLNAADVQQVRRLQAERREQQRSGTGPAHFSISVAAAACHRGGLPAGAILSSTYLKLEAAAGYMPVIDDLDLRKELDAEALARDVPPCG